VPYGAPVSMLIPPLDIYIPLDDLSTKARIQGDINTYVNECIAKFTTGAMNIETDWERFQGELKNLGIDRLLSMIQTAYDASAFAKKQNL
jgi:putative aldouronate transport system substrate-binding protein